MRNRSKFWITLWAGLCLLAWSLPVYATHDDEREFDPLEILEWLKKKKEMDEEYLERYSQMVKIPEGEFLMGRDSFKEDERPPHRVYLKTFYMDKYEVTQIQYLGIMKKNPSYFHDCPLCPVERVTYYQAATFCRKAGKRLPTEAEWEKAARGGTDHQYYWENDLIDHYAWYGNNSGGKTQPVGLRKPNAYGLHDMAGNVWEWVRDWYDPNYYSVSPARDPEGPESGTKKVIRGGGWGQTPEFLAHAYRDSREPGTRYIEGGFRCAADTNVDLEFDLDEEEYHLK